MSTCLLNVRRDGGNGGTLPERHWPATLGSDPDESINFRLFAAKKLDWAMNQIAGFKPEPKIEERRFGFYAAIEMAAQQSLLDSAIQLAGRIGIQRRLRFGTGEGQEK